VSAVRSLEAGGGTFDLILFGNEAADTATIKSVCAWLKPLVAPRSVA